MSEGFDYQAFQRQVNGRDPDRALIVTFEPFAEKQKDGSFKNVDYIRIWISNSDEIHRRVTDEDKARFRDRWEAYQRNEAVPVDGTPISECLFADKATLAGCKSLRIYTLEQLAETADGNLTKVGLLNFKYKVIDYLKAQKNFGHVGEMREEINELRAQLEMLKEQNKELKSATAEDEPKRRGRPPKVRDADDAA